MYRDGAICVLPGGIVICGKCGVAVPDLALSCPVCAKKKSDEACLALQAGPLKEVVAGTVALHLRTTNGIAHVQMFGLGVPFAFCGQALHALNKHKYLSFSDWPKAKVCPGCRAMINAMLEPS